MSNAASNAADGFKAVCYRCKYKTFSSTRRSCPQCDFPLILLPGHESAKLDLREIFDRTSVEIGVNVNAPRLPGLDEQNALPASALSVPATPAAHAGDPGVVPARHRSHGLSTASMVLALASAIAVGVVAAVVQSGW